jgi:hypothetical protein
MCAHTLLRLPIPQTAVKAAIDKWEEANGEDPAEAKKVRWPAGPLLSAGASRRTGLCAQMPGYAGQVM